MSPASTGILKHKECSFHADHHKTRVRASLPQLWRNKTCEIFMRHRFSDHRTVSVRHRALSLTKGIEKLLHTSREPFLANGFPCLCCVCVRLQSTFGMYIFSEIPDSTRLTERALLRVPDGRRLGHLTLGGNSRSARLRRPEASAQRRPPPVSLGIKLLIRMQSDQAINKKNKWSVSVKCCR